MSSSPWRRAVQFRLRTLLCFVTLLAVAGGAFLLWWRTPFVVERYTSETRWEHLDLLQASLPLSGKFTFREQARVYRDLRGGHINHGPLTVFDGRGKLRVEHWSHGVLHGPWIDWDLNGVELARGEYRNGEQHGLWVIHLPQNGPEIHVTYDCGVKRESKVHYPGGRLHHRRYGENGNLVEDSAWESYGGAQVMVSRSRHSERNGSSWESLERWFPEGGKQVVGQLRDGLETGEWTFWKPDGWVARQVTFSAGELVGSEGASVPRMLFESRDEATQGVQPVLEDIAFFEFKGIRLCDILSYIDDTHAVPCRLNEAALERAGISPEATLTFDVRGVSLRAALQMMLHDLGLAMVVQPDAVLVTTREDAVQRCGGVESPKFVAGPATR